MAFCAVILVWATQRDSSAGLQAARRAVPSLADAELSGPQSSAPTPSMPIDSPTEAPTGLATILIEPSSLPLAMRGVPAPAQGGAHFEAGTKVSERIADPRTGAGTETPVLAAGGPARRASASANASAYILAQAAEGQKLDPAALIARGDEFLRYSDVASARLFYKLAASHGSAAGAIAMGSSYDPIFLERNGVRGVRPEPGRALAWYRIASELGDAGGKARSDRLLEVLRQDAARGDPQAKAILESAIR